MKANKSPIKIKLIPTEEEVWIYVKNVKEVIEEFKDADVEDDCYGVYFKNTNRKGHMKHVIYISKWMPEVLVHELMHLIDFFSEEMELKSKELRAYYMDYVFNIVYKKFNKVVK